MGGVGGAVWSHGCCGRAGLLSVPVGGGPPASRPRRELRSARRLEARPGPAAAHGHRSQAVPTRWPGCLKPPSPLRVRNGRFWCSFRVQWRCRFQRCLVGGEQWCCWFQRRHVVAPRARKSSHPAWPDVGASAKKFALHAQNTPKSAFLRLLGEFFRGRAAGGAVLGEFFRANWPCVDLGCDAVHFRLAAMGVLRHAKPSDGVSPACWRLGWRHSPRFEAVRWQLGVVWRPKRRPPR